MVQKKLNYKLNLNRDSQDLVLQMVEDVNEVIRSCLLLLYLPLECNNLIHYSKFKKKEVKFLLNNLTAILVYSLTSIS